MILRLGFTLLIFAIVLAFPSTAFADVAPPYNPPGVNPEPESESTQVRMLAETVVIDVKNEGDLGSARITADFTMRNIGSQPENLAIRFPISADNGRGEYPELKNLAIKVDGKQITAHRVNYPDIRYQLKDVPWAEFDVAFPQGRDVAIQVAYDLYGSGYSPHTAFYYILQTGAGWKDTIGTADIILRLPYEASPQNVIMEMQIGWAETTPGGEFQGNEVRWHFEDFEPGFDGPVADMEFALVSPKTWTSVLTEQKNVTKSPNDGEAWGRLAKTYKESYFLNKGYRTDSGGEELYRLSIEAYEKCLSIKPDDAQWHAGFADLLIGRSYWDSWMGSPSQDAYRGLDEIHTALQLAPNDPVVLEIAQNIQYMFPEGMTQSNGGYDFPWLTQTPTLVPPTPTIAPLFDPAIIPGTYQSGLVTLNNRKAQLILNLRSDFSADLETKFEGGQTEIERGTWEMGDINITLSLPGRYNQKTIFLFYVKENSNGLQAIEYPSTYSAENEEAMEFKKIGVTPRTAADTSIPTPSGPSPASQPSPLCGSAALAPLVMMIWMKRTRDRKNPASK